MTIVTSWDHESRYIKPLSPACRLCAQGAKMVVLITGICPASCYYCPLSIQKGGKDLIFADEWQLKNEEETDILIQEAGLIGAKGAGITGGDPLSVPERTIHFITLLKDHYGESFHIHLYTSGIENIEYLPELASSGLDELRFHPPPSEWKEMDVSRINKAIRLALQTSMDIAIEIPAIPTMKQDILNLISWADKQQINWVNLNELEFSERNEQNLRKKGFIEKNDVSAAVEGSQSLSYGILENIRESNLNIGVHYCSSSFKDGVQLKNRMVRRAHHIATSLDIITQDATILKGIIQGKNKIQIQTILDFLIKTYHLTSREYILIATQNIIQVPIPLLELAAESLQKFKVQCYISEQYPTHDQLEVERIPLPMKKSLSLD